MKLSSPLTNAIKSSITAISASTAATIARTINIQQKIWGVQAQIIQKALEIIIELVEMLIPISTAATIARTIKSGPDDSAACIALTPATICFHLLSSS